MADETQPGAEDETEAEASAPLGGERLAASRRAQKITIQEIVKELHLDEPKVLALERNDFDMLGAPVFAKGHLRKYAQLVGVDADDVLADYYRITRSAGMPPVVSGQRRRVSKEFSPGPWIIAIIVLVAAVAAYWWFSTQPAQDEPAAPAADYSEPAEPAAAGLPEEELADDTAVLSGAPVDDESEVRPDDAGAAGAGSDAGDAAPAASTATAEAPTADAPPAGPGRVRLALSFSGDCWTEISDADGNRLFFGMGRDGRSVELIGTAPISVLFGDADKVTVWVDGQDFKIPPASRRGRTALLQIGNP